MKQIGAAASQAVTTIKQELDKPKSTAIALQPRETPLTVADFAKLEELVTRDCVIKPITKTVNVPKKDTTGFVYGWELDLIPVGLSIAAVDKKLPAQLIEALQRPATPTGAIYHFTRLAATKRNTRGDTGFQVALEDLAYDLRGRSEWAIMKACEHFRREASPFFPDHSAILEKVELFDRAALEIKPEPLQIEGPKSDEKNG